MSTQWMKHALIGSVLTVLMALPATAQWSPPAPVARRPVKSAPLSIGDTRYSILKIGLSHPTENYAVEGWPGQGTQSNPYRIMLPPTLPNAPDPNSTLGGSEEGPELLRHGQAFKAHVQLTLPPGNSNLFGVWITILQKPSGAKNSVFRNHTTDLSRNDIRKHPNGNVRTPFGWVEMDGLAEGLYKLELKGRYSDGSFGMPKILWFSVTNPTIHVRQLYHIVHELFPGGGANRQLVDPSTARKLDGNGTMRRPFLLTKEQADQDGILVTGGTVTDPTNMAIEVSVVKESSMDRFFLMNEDHHAFGDSHASGPHMYPAFRLMCDNIPNQGNFRPRTRVTGNYPQCTGIPSFGVVYGESKLQESLRVGQGPASLPTGLHELHVRFYRCNEDAGVQTGQTLYLRIAEDDGKTKTKVEPPRTRPRGGLRPR